MKTYWITREKAAIELWVSTRTIDRYVKGGKLSYKKVANKVLLAKEEIEALKNEFSALHHEVSSELVSEVSNDSSSRDDSDRSKTMAVRADIDQAIEEKIDSSDFYYVPKICMEINMTKMLSKGLFQSKEAFHFIFFAINSAWTL